MKIDFKPGPIVEETLQTCRKCPFALAGFDLEIALKRALMFSTSLVVLQRNFAHQHY